MYRIGASKEFNTKLRSFSEIKDALNEINMGLALTTMNLPMSAEDKIKTKTVMNNIYTSILVLQQLLQEGYK